MMPLLGMLRARDDTVNSQSRTLKLGIIGLGADWESRYAPAIARLGTRVSIAAVSDVTPARAQEVARTFGATPVHGVRRLVQTPDLAAVLLLDFDWRGTWTLQSVATSGHDILIGQTVCRAIGTLPTWLQGLSDATTAIVPECRLRYEPSLLRLRELMATRLGSPSKATFDVETARQRLNAELTLVDVLNWWRATFDIRTDSATVTASRNDAVHVCTLNRRGRGLELVLGNYDDARNQRRPFCTVTCDHGHVELLGERELQWHSAEGDARETLEADRSATDVLIDLFARRAAEGLIPVPDLDDLRQAQRLTNLVLAARADSQ